MDMWKAFEKITLLNASSAAILYDQFHILSHLGKGMKWVLLSNRMKNLRELLNVTGMALLHTVIRKTKCRLGFVKGLNNKIRVIQRKAYGLRVEEYLRLKILTCKLDEPYKHPLRLE